MFEKFSLRKATKQNHLFVSFSPILNFSGCRWRRRNSRWMKSSEFLEGVFKPQQITTKQTKKEEGWVWSRWRWRWRRDGRWTKVKQWRFNPSRWSFRWVWRSRTKRAQDKEENNCYRAKRCPQTTMAERSRKGIENRISERIDTRASARSTCLFGSNEEISLCTKVESYQGQSEEYAGHWCQKMKTGENSRTFCSKFFILGISIYINFLRFLYSVNAELI